MINLYIGTYHKYNSGSLAGEWVELPQTEEELSATLNRIAKMTPRETAEDCEFMIQDFETDLNIKIEESDDIEQLNELAEKSENWNDTQKEAFGHFVDMGEDYTDAAEKVDKWDFYYIQADTDKELAENYIDDVYGGVEHLDRETLERYFDFESFGRELSYSFTKTDSGYIEDN